MLNGFRYHPDIIERYPNVIGGVLVVRDIQNRPSDDELRQAFEAEQQATLARIGSTPLSELMTLSAWRSVFRDFGVDPTQYRSAPEALLRRLTKQGDIPSINMMVDIGNLVSIRYGLPVAAFDARQVTGVVTVRFATGEENFTPLGKSEAEHPEPGEVIFVDEAGLVLARRWCWRQSEQTASREDTSHVLIAVEAQHPDSRSMVQNAQGDLIELITQHLGGSLISGILDIWRPQIPRE